MTGLLAVAALLLAGPAFAEEGEPEDVVVEVRDGVVVNWTRLVVQSFGEARARGTASSRKAVEHRARQQLGPGILDGALDVRVTSGLTVADLQQDPKLGSPINNRVTRWAVSESRYYASGKVELVGELALSELLKPWTLQRAEVAPTAERQPRFTGVVVDARGLDAALAFAPELRARDGSVLYASTVWEGARPDVVPVVYVSSPAHPAASRAGGRPLFVRAERADGADLVLTAEDTVRFRTGMQDARVLGQGTVVVVVDP